MTDRPPDPRPDVDDLLRTTLADDLPREVEARLNDQVERFLASRRTAVGPLAAAADWFASAFSRIAPSPGGRRLLAATFAVLVVCGMVLPAVGGPGVLAASVARVNQSVAVWTAVNRAASMRCEGGAADDLGSAAELAERLYRRWVFVASTVDATGNAAVLTFTSADDGARYEFVVDLQSMLPRRVVKTFPSRMSAPAGAVGGYDAVCNWEVPATESAPSASTLERRHGQR